MRRYFHSLTLQICRYFCRTAPFHFSRTQTPTMGGMSGKSCMHRLLFSSASRILFCFFFVARVMPSTHSTCREMHGKNLFSVILFFGPAYCVGVWTSHASGFDLGRVTETMLAMCTQMSCVVSVRDEFHTIR